MNTKRLRERARNMLKAWFWVPGALAALAFFSFWMSIVGNPHIAETYGGLLIAAIIFGAVTWKIFKKVR